MRCVEYVIARSSGRPAASQTERGHHETRVAEDLLGLDEPLSLDAADEVLHRHEDVVEEQRGRIRQPDAVLVFRLALGESFGAALEHEP